MNNIRAEIKEKVRDFYKTKSVVSIDNDNLEPFFTAGNLVAFDHQAPASNPQGMEQICDTTKQELQTLMKTHRIECVLFLLFQSARNELQIPELDGFSKMGLAENVQVSWGLGTQEEENVRLVTLTIT